MRDKDVDGIRIISINIASTMQSARTGSGLSMLVGIAEDSVNREILKVCA